jgi:hypothetical protein
MATLKAKEVESNILKKGFVKLNNDHKRFWLVVDGKTIGIRTFTSHNGQDINDYLQSQMAKQLKITKKEFADFAACKLSESDYINILKNKGELK